MARLFLILRIFSIIPFRFEFLSFLEKFAAISQGKGWGSLSIHQEVNSCLSLLKKEPQIFIDIGANKGLYSKFLLKKIGNVECHLFEPSRHNSMILKELFSSFDQVKINEIALSNANSKAKLFSDKPGSPLSSLSKRRLDHLNINMEIEELVEIQRFEEYWKYNYPIIDYVKIDVEGHELDVLDGFGDLIKQVRLIQFEFGGCNIDTRTYFQDFWYFFKDNDFSIYRITPMGPLRIKRYLEQCEFFSTTNYIALNNQLS